MRGVIAVLVVAFITGCGAAQTKQLASNGITLVVPSSWRVVDARSTLSREERELEKQNPTFGELLRRLEQPSNPVKLLALASAGRRFASTSMNLFVLRARPGESLDRYVREVVREWSAVPGFRNLTRRNTHISGNPAVELRYVLPYSFRGATVNLDTVQLLFLYREREVAVTFAADARAYPHYKEQFEASLRSIRTSKY
jgi:hypothetical protein